MIPEEEKQKIEEFLRWLDEKGYNFWIIEAIEKMLLKGEELREKKGGDKKKWR